MNNIFLLIIILISTGTTAQNLSGSVKDVETVQGIPYIALWNKTRQTGTVSNEQGLFKIVAYANDTIVLKSLQYKTRELIVRQLTDQTIMLTPNTRQLDNFIIYANEDPYEIIGNSFLSHKLTKALGINHMTAVRVEEDHQLVCEFTVDREIYYKPDTAGRMYFLENHLSAKVLTQNRQ